MARRATKVKEVRKTSENVLLLDGGNTLFGSQPLAKQTQGQAIVEAMNLLGYDAMVLGSEDFWLGLDVLRQRMEEAQFPILSANVVMAETDQLFATPYVIKEIADHKVALIGLTNQEAASAAGGDIVVLDPLETLENLMGEVSAKADVIWARRWIFRWLTRCRVLTSSSEACPAMSSIHRRGSRRAAR